MKRSNEDNRHPSIAARVNGREQEINAMQVPSNDILQPLIAAAAAVALPSLIFCLQKSRQLTHPISCSQQKSANASTNARCDESSFVTGGKASKGSHTRILKQMKTQGVPHKLLELHEQKQLAITKTM
jgi:hypothetical protein